MSRKLGAEFIGTFTLVSSVCGAALFSTFGRSYDNSIRYRSRCSRDGLCRGPHLRRTFQSRSDLWPRRGLRFEIGEAIPYIVVQVIGGAAAATIFYTLVRCACWEME